MPELDGLEATAQIRRRWPAHQQPRLIAMTANTLEGDREKYLQAGMDGYVSKPVRVNELTRALSQCQPLANRNRTGLSAKTSASVTDGPDSLNPGPVDFLILDEFEAMMGEGSQQMVAELITVFLEDTPKLVANMETAIAKNDVSGWEYAAHTLKASAGSLGASRLSALCLELEKLARTGT